MTYLCIFALSGILFRKGGFYTRDLNAAKERRNYCIVAPHVKCVHAQAGCNRPTHSKSASSQNHFTCSGAQFCPRMRSVARFSLLRRARRKRQKLQIIRKFLLIMLSSKHNRRMESCYSKHGRTLGFSYGMGSTRWLSHSYPRTIRLYSKLLQL